MQIVLFGNTLADFFLSASLVKPLEVFSQSDRNCLVREKFTTNNILWENLQSTDANARGDVFADSVW